MFAIAPTSYILLFRLLKDGTLSVISGRLINQIMTLCLVLSLSVSPGFNSSCPPDVLDAILLSDIRKVFNLLLIYLYTYTYVLVTY
jgi:hypothetical protein